MKPIVQILTLAMMLMLLTSSLATVQYKQMNDECQEKCNRVTKSWGTKLKSSQEIMTCEDICDLIKVSVKVGVQSIEYAVDEMLNQ